MKLNISYDAGRREEIVANFHGECEMSRRLMALFSMSSSGVRLQAFDEGGFFEASPERIECITVIDGKTYAVIEGKKYLLKMRLYELEAILPEYFIKINKSSLANEKKIARFSVAFSGAIDVLFDSGFSEYVSRRCFAEIKRRFREK